MYLLYYRPGCQFCQKVIQAGKDLSIDFELKDTNDQKFIAELVARSGKSQVPYIVDETKGIEMSESENIISYLKTGIVPSFSSPKKLNMHVSVDVCEVNESV